MEPQENLIHAIANPELLKVWSLIGDVNISGSENLAQRVQQRRIKPPSTGEHDARSHSIAHEEGKRVEALCHRQVIAILP